MRHFVKSRDCEVGLDKRERANVCINELLAAWHHDLVGPNLGLDLTAHTLVEVVCIVFPSRLYHRERCSYNPTISSSAGLRVDLKISYSDVDSTTCLLLSRKIEGVSKWVGADQRFRTAKAWRVVDMPLMSTRIFSPLESFPSNIVLFTNPKSVSRKIKNQNYNFP